jgi:hypothetical protein
MVKAEVQAARLSADVQISDVVAALKRAQRREIQQLCIRLRLTPPSFAGYQRMLLPEMTPLDRRPS